MMWTERPIKKQDVRPTRDHAHIKQLCLWPSCAETTRCYSLSLAGWASCDLSHSAPPCSMTTCYTAANTASVTLATDLTQRTRSSATLTALSTARINSHPCQCNIPREGHIMDWSCQTLPSQSKLKPKAISNVGLEILNGLGLPHVGRVARGGSWLVAVGSAPGSHRHTANPSNNTHIPNATVTSNSLPLTPIHPRTPH